MKRKVVSVVLALTMVAGMAVGCGSSKPAETTTTDDAAAEETTDAAEETDAADTADAAAEAVDGCAFSCCKRSYSAREMVTISSVLLVCISLFSM